MNPTVNKAQIEVKKDRISDIPVTRATPFVPSLKPKNPEQKLLNKGKNTIKLIIYSKL